jgi:hypothetical protein
VKRGNDILAHRFNWNEEDGVRKGIILAIGGLLLLAGCDKGKKASDASLEPKWKGEPYRITFDTQATKPNPTGVTIPVVKFTANPEALESRAVLVVKFDAAALTKNSDNGSAMNQMVMGPVDIHGEEGTLPAEYLDRASKDLSRFLGAYGAKGKISISVALARSSVNTHPTDAELDAKRLSDWLPTEVEFKKKG